MVSQYAAKSKIQPIGAEDLAAKLAADPLDVIEHGQKVQEYLCDSLELIADSLPDDVDQSLVASILPLLKEELGLYILDEEHGLFPLLEVRALPEDNIEELLAGLRREHATDEGYAAEVVEQLEDLVRGERPENPDMLGYMLRAFFETRRRHVVWEKAIILPLARKRLTAEDQKVLAARLLEHRGQHLQPKP